MNDGTISRSRDVTSNTIDIVADLNAQDDEGLCWSTLSSSVEPSLVVPGAVLIAGSVQARAKVRIAAVDDDGQVHFEILLNQQT